MGTWYVGFGGNAIRSWNISAVPWVGGHSLGQYSSDEQGLGRWESGQHQVSQTGGRPSMESEKRFLLSKCQGRCAIDFPAVH